MGRWQAGELDRVGARIEPPQAFGATTPVRSRIGTSPRDDGENGHGYPPRIIYY